MNSIKFSRNTLKKLSKPALIELALEKTKEQQNFSIVSGLKAEKLLFEVLFDTINEALFIVTEDSHEILYCNQAAVELFEVESKAKLLGNKGEKSYKQTLSANEQEKIKKALENTGEWKNKYRYLTEKGKEFWGFLTIKLISVLDQNYQLISLTNATAYVQKQVKLHEQQNRFNAIMESTEDLIWSIDRGYHLTMYNSSFEKRVRYLTGCDVKLSEYLFSEKYVNLPVDYWKACYDRALKGEKFRSEVEYDFSKNNIHCLDNSFNPVFDKEEHVIGVAVISRDVTEYKHIQDHLKKNQRLLSEMEKLTSVGGWEYQLDSGELYWTDETYRMHELEIGTKVDRDFAIGLYPPHIQPVMRSALESLVTEGKQYDMELPRYTAKGKQIWVRTVSNIEYENGKPKRLFGAFQDITQRKKAEEDIRKYALVAQKTDNGVIITDKDGNIEWANDSFYRITEYEPKEVIGKKPGELLQGMETDPEASKKILQARENKEKISIDLINYSKTGKKLWLFVDLQPILNEKGEVERFISILSDITERKKVENELRQAKQSLEEALEEKDNFVSVVSHEIRTPLNAIIGMADLLDSNASVAENQENISTLKTSSLSLLSFINDILDFSKMQSGKLRLEKVDFSVPSILRQTQQLFQHQAQKKNIKLETVIAEDVPDFVKGDPTRLLQVLNNLVGNAIKFTDHGKVTLQVKVGVQAGEAQILLVIEVKDTGIGIPSDKQKEIFEPFLQADVEINRVYGGTGLGLSIVKNLVEIQGGSIEVESVENKGTIFRLFLTYERGIEIQDDRKDEEKKSLAPLSVLYIEDVLTNQLLMKRICSRWDVKISMASNGYEGLKKVKTKQYDIILIDLRMTGADGFDTARKIRKMEDDYFKKVPVIAVTAASLEENIERIRQAGMDDAIAKPISQNRLYEIFKKYGKVDIFNTSRHKASQTYKVNGKKIFEHLDMIFQKDQKGYRKTLLAIRKEFNNYKEKLKTAIAEVDENEVSNIRHKIAGTSFILEHKSFYTFLKSLKNLHELSDLKLKLLLHEIDTGFDELIEEFDKKIRSLDSESNW